MIQARSEKFKKVFVILFVTLFTAFLYIVLHEGGHALVGILSGGNIETFNISLFNANVRISGEFTQIQKVWNNIAGVGCRF
jgi:hypothetical protein